MAIEANLHDLVEVRVLAPEPQDPVGLSRSGGCNNYNLVVVAASSPVSEPLLMLLRASLTSYIGQIPLLIISSRPFESFSEERIFHLDFPFHPEELRTLVGCMLQVGGFEHEP